MECEDASGDHNVCTRCHEPYSAVGGECVYLEQVALDKIAAMITEKSGKECVAPQLPEMESENCVKFNVDLHDDGVHVKTLFECPSYCLFVCHVDKLEPHPSQPSRQRLATCHTWLVCMTLCISCVSCFLILKLYMGVTN